MHEKYLFLSKESFRAEREEENVVKVGFMYYTVIISDLQKQSTRNCHSYVVEFNHQERLCM